MTKEFHLLLKELASEQPYLQPKLFQLLEYLMQILFMFLPLSASD